MISTSPIRISCVVRKADAERALRSRSTRGSGWTSAEPWPIDRSRKPPLPPPAPDAAFDPAALRERSSRRRLRALRATTPAVADVARRGGELVVALCRGGWRLVASWPRSATARATSDRRVRSVRLLRRGAGRMGAHRDRATSSRADQLFRPATAPRSDMVIQLQTGQGLAGVRRTTSPARRDSGLKVGEIRRSGRGRRRAAQWDCDPRGVRRAARSARVVFARDGAAWRVQLADSGRLRRARRRARIASCAPGRSASAERPDSRRYGESDL